MRAKGLIISSFVAGTLLIAGAWSFYTVFIKAPTELARATAQGIQEFFNFTPRVKIDQTIVIEQNAPIMEIATVSRQLMVDYTWLHTWLGSTKTIHLVGTFTAKAGFDLKEPFTIEIERIFGAGSDALTRRGLFSISIVNGSLRSKPALAVNVPTRWIVLVLPNQVCNQV